MLKNYFKIAWRNIIRHKIYTAINVIGLALGICACLVIYLITSYDFSFDRFHPDGNRIYRIVGEMQSTNGEKRFLNSPFSDVAGIQTQIPGFEASSGFHDFGTGVTIPGIGKASKTFEEGELDGDGLATIITGPQYFDIFKYQWLAGNAASLKEPFRVVISEKAARKYFGNIPIAEILGKKMIYSDSLEVTVSGIVKDWDKNSDFGFTNFISISSATHSFLKAQIPTEDWSSLSPHRSQAFVKLSKGVTADQVNGQLVAFIKTQVKNKDMRSNLKMWLQPLTSIHFTSDFHRGDDGDNQFRKAYLPTLYALMSVAVFILIIAAVNFINLSTAQSIQRAKEIGIRKVLGSKRWSLVFQFLTETLILSLCAVLISLLLVKPVIYFFSDYIPGGVKFTWTASTLIFLITITLTITLLAGFYPAKVLSGYLPVQSLKGDGTQKGSEKWYLRKGLIIFQFSISLIFIIGTLVIGNQIRYMRDSDKGFQTNAIATINRNWDDHSKEKAGLFKESIKQIPGIDAAILEAFAPMGFPHMGSSITYKGKTEIKVDVSIQPANEGLIPFYNMKMLAGRNLFPSDTLKEFVINETCSRSLGFTHPDEALGILISWWDGKSYPVVGVVADFFENSFHEPMKPVMLVHMPDQEKSVAIKLASKGQEGGFVKKIMGQVEKKWKDIYPNAPFEYHFLDESISWLYDQETKTQSLMNVAMMITIFISCMGIFGVAMFTAERRTKEIGIRKVLGATVINITSMLSKDFLILVLLALVLASPIAWYLMSQWLQDFAYRTNISWWVFIIAGLGALGIAMVTVSFQAIKAAIANPVKSLRTE
jgi:putative ABC transport system permease protein